MVANGNDLPLHKKASCPIPNRSTKQTTQITRHNVANFVAFLDGYHMQLFALKFSDSAELSKSRAFIRSLPRDQWSGQSLKHCKHMVLFAHVLEADFAHPHLRAKPVLPPPLEIGVISLLKHQAHW